MRATFEVSPEEVVDLALRSRSRALKRFHWIVVAGLGVILFFWTALGADGSGPGYVVAAVVGFVAAAVAHHPQLERPGRGEGVGGGRRCGGGTGALVAAGAQDAGVVTSRRQPATYPS